ncbi:MAG: signal peptidase I [Lachnospiraceae bacterium]|nr:signal peptidase I [Lachnospiraceae bacterium]
MASLDFYSIENEEHRLRSVVNWIVDIVVAIVLAVLLVTWFGDRATVNGHSMEPVLKAEDVVLIDEFSYQISEPERLDIVLYQLGEKTSIKRIVGLPGETIQIKNGYLYIDGVVKQLPSSLAEVVLAGLAEEEITLGSDEYFLLGDNRESSEDSRFEKVGNVAREQILGKIWFRVSPFVEMGPIG